MKRLKFLVSLVTEDNDYQVEQASAAVETARRLDVDLQVVYAQGDAITQSQQLLKVIQGPADSHPNGIIFEPVGGTALPQVARAATSAGIGWVVLNREIDYIAELRRSVHVPVFSISSDHLEIGRIQGHQLGALLPKGGTAIYMQGPSDNPAAKARTTGMQQTKPASIKLIMLKGQWTEDSAYRSICSWMKLSTSQKLPIDTVCSQNDAMAMGVRKAFQEQADQSVREKWLALPFTGCDGLPKTGLAYVRSGLLAATVVIPPNTTLAMELLVKALEKGSQPAALALTVPSSSPTIEDLASRHKDKNRTLSH